MEATSAADVPEGPVMSLVNKRIRALRKKLNRITQMEESIAQGKQLNKEQEEVLRSKPSVSILIEELEKFRQPLTTAVSEEIDLAIQQIKVSPDLNATHEGSETQERPTSEEPKLDDSAVEDLLNLLYFGSLFDVKPQSDFTSTMLTRTHERGCCLTYDYVTDDATDLLGEKDLDMLSVLGGLLISRSVDSSLSHKNALQSCIQHAKLWLSNSEQPLDTNSNVSYAGLREKLRKIMASEYFTTTPEIKAHIEVAAAAGNYAPFQVPVMPIAVQFQEDGSAGQYQQKEDTSNLQEHEAADSQSSLGDENQNDGVDIQNSTEFVSDHQEHLNSQTEVEQQQYPREVEYKEEQQYGSRRPYQNQRGGRVGNGGGGGRRGYSNGRGGRNGGNRGGGGGGTYQNGGRNQFYDQQQQQPGNYYPRNYYNNNNNRGGRGGRSGGQPYHNGSTVQGGHSANDVGVAS